MHLLCAWTHDGATSHRTCSPPGVSDTCVPGCYHGHGQTRGTDDDDDGPPRGEFDFTDWHVDSSWGPFRSWELDRMLRKHESIWRGRAHTHSCGQDFCVYNEVVVDAAVWEENLPSTIEAVFFLGGSALGASDDDDDDDDLRNAQGLAAAEQHMREVHADFLDAYGLDASEVPLLRLELEPDTDEGHREAPAFTTEIG